MSEGLNALDAKIETFERLLEEMKEQTREAHSVLKQIRTERREIDRLLSVEVKKLVDQNIGKVVETELEKIGPELHEQTSRIYARVNREVDKLIDISLGKEFSAIHGREDLRPMLAEKMKQWIMEVIREGPIRGTERPSTGSSGPTR